MSGAPIDSSISVIFAAVNCNAAPSVAGASAAAASGPPAAAVHAPSLSSSSDWEEPHPSAVLLVPAFGMGDRKLAGRRFITSGSPLAVASCVTERPVVVLAFGLHTLAMSLHLLSDANDSMRREGEDGRMDRGMGRQSLRA